LTDSGLQTRRRLLQGVVVLPAIALSPTVVSAGADDNVGALVKGLTVLLALESAYIGAFETTLELQGVYAVGRPFRPKELYWNLTPKVQYEHAFYVEPNGKRHSFVSGASIEKLRTDPGLSTGALCQDGDRLIVHGGRDLPTTPAAKRFWAREDAKSRAAAKSIVDAYDRWKAACQAYADEIGLTAAIKTERETESAFRGEIARLLALPVSTIQGFSLKAKIVRDFDDTATDALLEELAALWKTSA
jgi:hypothetical protein